MMKPNQSLAFPSVSRWQVQRNLKSWVLAAALRWGSRKRAVAALSERVSRYVIALLLVKRPGRIGWPTDSKRTHGCGSKFDQAGAQSGAEILQSLIHSVGFANTYA